MDLKERFRRIKENITATVPQRTLSNYLTTLHEQEPGRVLSKIEIETHIRRLPYEAANLATESPYYDKDRGFLTPFPDGRGNTWQINANSVQNMEISVSNDKGTLFVTSTYIDTIKKDHAVFNDPFGKTLVEFTSIGGIITITKPLKKARQ